jgi:hypothetical protein
VKIGMEKSCSVSGKTDVQSLERVQTRLHLTDIVDGLVAVFALKGIRSISAADDRIDQSMQQIFPSIERLAEERGLEVLFRIHLHPFHGDSPAVQNALFSTTQMGFITWDSPGKRDMRIKITSESAEALLNQLPGGKQMYEVLAEEFLNCYQNPVFFAARK